MAERAHHGGDPSRAGGSAGGVNLDALAQALARLVAGGSPASNDPAEASPEMVRAVSHLARSVADADRAREAAAPAETTVVAARLDEVLSLVEALPPHRAVDLLLDVLGIWRRVRDTEMRTEIRQRVGSFVDRRAGALEADPEALARFVLPFHEAVGHSILEGHPLMKGLAERGVPAREEAEPGDEATAKAAALVDRVTERLSRVTREFHASRLLGIEKRTDGFLARIECRTLQPTNRRGFEALVTSIARIRSFFEFDRRFKILRSIWPEAIDAGDGEAAGIPARFDWAARWLDVESAATLDEDAFTYLGSALQTGIGAGGEMGGMEGFGEGDFLSGLPSLEGMAGLGGALGSLGPAPGLGGAPALGKLELGSAGGLTGSFRLPDGSVVDARGLQRMLGAIPRGSQGRVDPSLLIGMTRGGPQALAAALRAGKGASFGAGALPGARLPGMGRLPFAAPFAPMGLNLGGFNPYAALGTGRGPSPAISRLARGPGMLGALPPLPAFGLGGLGAFRGPRMSGGGGRSGGLDHLVLGLHSNLLGAGSSTPWLGAGSSRFGKLTGVPFRALGSEGGQLTGVPFRALGSEGGQFGGFPHLPSLGGPAFRGLPAFAPEMRATPGRLGPLAQGGRWPEAAAMPSWPGLGGALPAMRLPRLDAGQAYGPRGVSGYWPLGLRPYMESLPAHERAALGLPAGMRYGDWKSFHGAPAPAAWRGLGSLGASSGGGLPFPGRLPSFPLSGGLGGPAFRAPQPADIGGFRGLGVGPLPALRSKGFGRMPSLAGFEPARLPDLPGAFARPAFGPYRPEMGAFSGAGAWPASFGLGGGAAGTRGFTAPRTIGTFPGLRPDGPASGPAWGFRAPIGLGEWDLPSGFGRLGSSGSFALPHGGYVPSLPDLPGAFPGGSPRMGASFATGAPFRFPEAGGLPAGGLGFAAPRFEGISARGRQAIDVPHRFTWGEGAPNLSLDLPRAFPAGPGPRGQTFPAFASLPAFSRLAGSAGGSGGAAPAWPAGGASWSGVSSAGLPAGISQLSFPSAGAFGGQSAPLAFSTPAAAGSRLQGAGVRGFQGPAGAAAGSPWMLDLPHVELPAGFRQRRPAAAGRPGGHPAGYAHGYPDVAGFREQPRTWSGGVPVPQGATAPLARGYPGRFPFFAPPTAGRALTGTNAPVRLPSGLTVPPSPTFAPGEPPAFGSHPSAGVGSAGMPMDFVRGAPTFAGAVPTFAGAVPSFSGAVPSFAGAVPSFAGAVPSFAGAVPSFAGAVPSFAGAVPSFAGAVPAGGAPFAPFPGMASPPAHWPVGIDARSLGSMGFADRRLGRLAGSVGGAAPFYGSPHAFAPSYSSYPAGTGSGRFLPQGEPMARGPRGWARPMGGPRIGAFAPGARGAMPYPFLGPEGSPVPRFEGRAGPTGGVRVAGFDEPAVRERGAQPRFPLAGGPAPSGGTIPAIGPVERTAGPSGTFEYLRPPAGLPAGARAPFGIPTSPWAPFRAPGSEITVPPMGGIAGAPGGMTLDAGLPPGLAGEAPRGTAGTSRLPLALPGFGLGGGPSAAGRLGRAAGALGGARPERGRGIAFGSTPEGRSLQAIIPGVRGPGRTLDPGVATVLEPVFPGKPLQHVRLHTDRTADALTRQAGAPAFSLDRDIYFRQGRFDPRSPEGLELLGHEVHHAVNPARMIRRQGDPATTATERAAATAGDAAKSSPNWDFSWEPRKYFSFLPKSLSLDYGSGFSLGLKDQGANLRVGEEGGTRFTLDTPKWKRADMGLSHGLFSLKGSMDHFDPSKLALDLSFPKGTGVEDFQLGYGNANKEISLGWHPSDYGVKLKGVLAGPDPSLGGEFSYKPFDVYANVRRWDPSQVTTGLRWRSPEAGNFDVGYDWGSDTLMPAWSKGPFSVSGSIPKGRFDLASGRAAYNTGNLSVDLAADPSKVSGRVGMTFGADIADLMPGKLESIVNEPTTVPSGSGLDLSKLRGIYESNRKKVDAVERTIEKTEKMGKGPSWGFYLKGGVDYDRNTGKYAPAGEAGLLIRFKRPEAQGGPVAGFLPRDSGAARSLTGARSTPLPDRDLLGKSLGLPTERLSDLRLRTGGAAADAGRRLGAEAFTVGRDVYLARDRFVRSRDLPIVAHEVSHAVSPHPSTRAVAEAAERHAVAEERHMRALVRAEVAVRAAPPTPMPHVDIAAGIQRAAANRQIQEQEASGAHESAEDSALPMPPNTNLESLIFDIYDRLKLLMLIDRERKGGY